MVCWCVVLGMIVCCGFCLKLVFVFVFMCLYGG